MSLHNPFEFILSDNTQLTELTNRREGETKLGETMCCGSINPDTKIVLLGIQESNGPLANLGLSGAEKAFPAFLSRFVNMQDNAFLSGKHICYLGKIVQHSTYDTITELREAVETLDQLVYEIIKPYFKKGILVVVVGGGHNNAYPLIKAASHAIQSPINVVNLDPHADCRKLEGRHSGNSFSLAYSEGILKKYTVLGLHKAYNSSFLFDQLNHMNASFTFFEDYLLNDEQFKTDILEAKKSNQHKPHGVELDLDSIAYMPSSAFSPSGFSVEQARWYLRTLLQPKTCYVHLTEGAPTTPLEEKIIGKALAYMVADLVELVSIKD
jgi:formiminoglutamase